MWVHRVGSISSGTYLPWPGRYQAQLVKSETEDQLSYSAEISKHQHWKEFDCNSQQTTFIPVLSTWCATVVGSGTGVVVGGCHWPLFEPSAGKKPMVYPKLILVSIGHPRAFFKLSIGKNWYKQTGADQIGPIHPPPSFSHHQTITRTLSIQIPY